MISARHALLRQAQEYFHQHLLGVIKWDDVEVDKPIPIPAVNGVREQGKFKDIVIAHFNGFRMEIIGPFEREEYPLGYVEVMRGAKHIRLPLDAKSWERVARWIKEQKMMGDEDGTEDSHAGAGEAWGRR